MASLQQHLGVWRSLAIYYGNPQRRRRMTEFYRELVTPGSLCFDIGAHVGSRIGPMLRTGARVVALEPQPQLMTVLNRLYGSSHKVILLQEAAGANPGTATLLASPTNPTVATLSAEWVNDIRNDSGFAGITWVPAGTVVVTTLDALIEQFGRPDYCKIDVEGYELDVLRGLSQPLPVISFEYIPLTMDRAAACVAHLLHLGDYEFNWFEGETHRWQSARWLSPAEFNEVVTHLATQHRSGDIFARSLSVT